MKLIKPHVSKLNYYYLEEFSKKCDQWSHDHGLAPNLPRARMVILHAVAYTTCLQLDIHFRDMMPYHPATADEEIFRLGPGAGSFKTEGVRVMHHLRE